MNEKEGFVRYVRKTGTSLGVSIPAEIIEVLNLKESEIVRITVEKVKKGGKN